MSTTLPHMKKPCKNCPFRKDTAPGWLGSDRMNEICSASSFVCHKTTQGSLKDRKQCAGHMILNGDKNEFVSLAKAMHIDVSLSGKNLIFPNIEDAVDHHKFK